ncbi:hypothetical protein CPB83DRAFT_859337 [Crepidotus variabilis]|uniref:Cysteine-rich transmembrane CYSTM domain-containing protein n=1 Tax=Crepidotus variabilis TaxID=179855 RepID=A0A9P6E9Z1_9AGAR|nr:hypothetical protein CPB83DRAFT_859337 [Crepidotus variabilis]
MQPSTGKVSASFNQPQAATEMKVMTPSTPSTQEDPEAQTHHKHNHGAWRLRGGGAGKDCFLGIIGCFLCCECCEGCCDCIGDIICCPCEMLC